VGRNGKKETFAAGPHHAGNGSRATLSSTVECSPMTFDVLTILGASGLYIHLICQEKEVILPGCIISFSAVKYFFLKSVGEKELWEQIWYLSLESKD
jgi:hypothetical protein